MTMEIIRHTFPSTTSSGWRWRSGGKGLTSPRSFSIVKLVSLMGKRAFLLWP
jgi:hypothetical protein